jgi:hypothetical protein
MSQTQLLKFTCAAQDLEQVIHDDGQGAIVPILGHEAVKLRKVAQ